MCKKCIQHHIKCEYAESSLGPSSTPVRDRSLSPWSTSFQAESASPCEHEPQKSVQENDDLLNVQLMHHFTTSTYKTLVTTPKQRSLWFIQIPKLGFEHRYVLDMIFAVTAVHKSREAPSDPSHMAYAFRLYETSLKESSVALSQISPANCDALYVFSVLALVFELGTLRSRESLLFNHDGSLAHWIVNCRGIHAIIGSSWHDLTSGISKPMFECSLLDAGPEGIETHLEVFQSYIESEFSSEAAEVYLKALSDLAHSSRLANSGFFGWLCRFSNDYGDLLSQKDPYALIIFGYSCVTLKHAGPVYWIKECPERLLLEIYEHLNTSLRHWLLWPMTELGLVW